MSANVAAIYAGDLGSVAEAFGEAAQHLSAEVRLLTVADAGGAGVGSLHAEASLRDLEWADGIAFGTPVGDGAPDPALMGFIEGSEHLWSSGRLYEKAVTVFTDEPEHLAPDSVLHPIYDALYRWGGVIVGPRGFELEASADPQPAAARSSLSAGRLRSAQYRARRLARLADVLAQERARREGLEL
jgi:NAD(P)H dehydrogenase (quinone)